MSHKISFIISARNELQSIVDATIFQLLETTSDYEKEILLIDDGSDVPLERPSPEVMLLRNKQAMGIGGSRRYGASIASGDVLAWLDAHLTFGMGWLDQMMAHVDSGALLCSASWDYYLTRPYCWGADLFWQATRDYRNRRSPGFRWRHRIRNPGHGAVDVGMVIGACYMMDRKSYNQIGGLSPLFINYGAGDIDLSIRAWMAGLGVKCVTGAKVGHLYRTSFPYRVKWEHIEFNQLVMVRTIFEERTVGGLERYFEPVPEQVNAWFEEVDWKGWRDVVQSHRRISDEEFFETVEIPTGIFSVKDEVAVRTPPLAR